MTVKIAVIGGTGVYDPSMMSGIREEKIKTPYGAVTVLIGSYGNREIAFIARHGHGHSVPPHLVNYRANIAALKQLGVEKIIATAAVGSANMAMPPGHFVFVDQFLDFTKSRPTTFVENGVVHVDMTEPYCPGLRKLLAATAAGQGLDYHESGTYACTEGPRFETAAEVKMFRHMGADVLGMTGVPEVVLAREAGMCYAAVAVVTNFGTGISPVKLTHQEVVEYITQNEIKIRKLIMQAVSELETAGGCECGQAVAGVLQIIGSKR